MAPSCLCPHAHSQNRYNFVFSQFLLCHKSFSMLLITGSPRSSSWQWQAILFPVDPGSCDRQQFVTELRQVRVSLSWHRACLPTAPARWMSSKLGFFGYHRKKTLVKVGKAVCMLWYAQKMWTFTQNVIGDKVRALFSELGVAEGLGLGH